jgi:hypothetical protein
VTALNGPGGGSFSPNSSPPQHAIVPSVRSAHVFSMPALTAVKAPYAGVAWPKVFRPQHAMLPSRLRAQV